MEMQLNYDAFEKVRGKYLKEEFRNVLTIGRSDVS